MEETGSLIDITDAEFNAISVLVRENFGINLTEKKRMLVKGRLNKRLHQMGHKNFQSYYDWIIQDTTGMGLLELVDKISTNHTMFFREAHHFLFLEQEVIPGIADKLKRTRSRDVRVWCAGCSSGEEAYTIAMVLAESLGPDFFTAGSPILATDISSTALETAIAGIYPADRIEIVSKPLLQKYFETTDDGQYAVKDTLKKLVTFRRLNLMREHYPFKGRFDFIFCRNVMIYFDKTTKDRLVMKMGRVLREGGYLFIGHSETLGRKNTEFTYVQPAVYIKQAGS